MKTKSLKIFKSSKFLGGLDSFSVTDLFLRQLWKSTFQTDFYPFTTKLELVQYKLMIFSYTTKLSHLDQLKLLETFCQRSLQEQGPDVSWRTLERWKHCHYCHGITTPMLMEESMCHVPGGTSSPTLSPAPRVRTAHSYDSTNPAILLIISTSSLWLWAVPTHNKCCHYFLMGPLCSWVLLASY